MPISSEIINIHVYIYKILNIPYLFPYLCQYLLKLYTCMFIYTKY